MSHGKRPETNATLPQIRLDDMVLSPLARQLFDALRAVLGPQLATAIVRDAVPRAGAKLAHLHADQLAAVVTVIKEATRALPNAQKIAAALDTLARDLAQDLGASAR